MNARAKELASKIEVNQTTGAVTLPKPEWKGRTLSQEMAEFDAQKQSERQL